MVTNFVSSMNFNSILFSPPFFPKKWIQCTFLENKNQEPNNLINQKDKKYIVPSTDIQKIDEIHSRETFKDFLDYSLLIPLNSLILLFRSKSDQNILLSLAVLFLSQIMFNVLNIHGIFQKKTNARGYKQQMIMYKTSI